MANGKIPGPLHVFNKLQTTVKWSEDPLKQKITAINKKVSKNGFWTKPWELAQFLLCGLLGSNAACKQSQKETALTDLPWNVLQTPHMLNPHSVSRNNDSLLGISFFLPPSLLELSVNQEAKFWRHLASQNNLSYPFSKRQDLKTSCTHSWDSSQSKRIQVFNFCYILIGLPLICNRRRGDGFLLYFWPPSWVNGLEEGPDCSQHPSFSHQWAVYLNHPKGAQAAGIFSTVHKSCYNSYAMWTQNVLVKWICHGQGSIGTGQLWS